MPTATSSIPIQTVSQSVGQVPGIFAFSRLTIHGNDVPGLPMSSIDVPRPGDSIQTLSSRSKRVRQTPSPQSAQIEYFKKKLSIAQTRITALENDVRRKEETCKILEERIKTLEHPAMTNMFDRYIPQDNTNSATCSTVSCPAKPILDRLSADIALLSGSISTLSGSLNNS